MVPGYCRGSAALASTRRYSQNRHSGAVAPATAFEREQATSNTRRRTPIRGPERRLPGVLVSPRRTAGARGYPGGHASLGGPVIAQRTIGPTVCVCSAASGIKRPRMPRVVDWPPGARATGCRRRGDRMTGPGRDGLGSWSLGQRARGALALVGEANSWGDPGGWDPSPGGVTVTNLERSRQFYTGLLGFEVAVESPPPGDPSAAETFKILFGGSLMARGNLLMGLRPMAPSGERFDPDRVGLDHLSYSVASHDDLEQAMRLFDERGVAAQRDHEPAVVRD